jgi:hypothetical protein
MAEGQELVKATYGSHYQRLAAIKAAYDPDNLFRMNQNIEPDRTITLPSPAFRRGQRPRPAAAASSRQGTEGPGRIARPGPSPRT